MKRKKRRKKSRGTTHPKRTHEHISASLKPHMSVGVLDMACPSMYQALDPLRHEKYNAVCSVATHHVIRTFHDMNPNRTCFPLQLG
jgi:hypothetical protein